jgi:hypothetical protein
VARLMLALILLIQGDLIAARSRLERDAVLERMKQLSSRSALIPKAGLKPTSPSPIGIWAMSSVLASLIDQALLRAEKLGQPGTIASALHWKSILESRRGDVSATAASAGALLRLIEEHGIKQYAAIGRIHSN